MVSIKHWPVQCLTSMNTPFVEGFNCETNQLVTIIKSLPLENDTSPSFEKTQTGQQISLSNTVFFEMPIHKLYSTGTDEKFTKEFKRMYIYATRLRANSKNKRKQQVTVCAAGLKTNLGPCKASNQL